MLRLLVRFTMRMSHPSSRSMFVIQSFGPLVLIVNPPHLAGLAEYAADSIVKDRLALREVMQDEPDRPFAWRDASGPA